MARFAIALTVMAALPITAALAASCGSPATPNPVAGGGGSGAGGSAPVVGALISVNLGSRVGVLLDELPMAMRDRVAASLIAEPAAFWTARAKDQVGLTAYRLVFRKTYYTTMPPKDSLPLPLADHWTVTLGGSPARAMVDGHDVVAVDYKLATTLLTDETSPGHSESELGKVGGKWSEPFIFPIDPELVLQRTGYACINEAEFPPNSVDPEEVSFFYDQTCDLEAMRTHTGCHYTELPTMSCVTALTASVGKVATTLDYERLPWDPAAAALAREGAQSTDAGADLQAYAPEFRQNRISYKYFEPTSCTLIEKCIAAPGWRRLIQFTAAEQNTGNAVLDIGKINYFLDDAGTPLSEHGIYEWSACHEHWHFMHYGSFTFGAGQQSTSKRGFCLQSTERTVNAEWSPLSNPYYDCGYQGIQNGWGDEYNAGIECQWIDVTDVSTKHGPVTAPLTWKENPDGFLCEGTPVLDAKGAQVWVPTSLKTATGQPVEKPACNYAPGWQDNNTDSYPVTLPPDGQGYITGPCGHGELGPLRNCAFALQQDKLACAPGAKATLSCTAAAGAAPQAVRLCERSAVLDTALPCTSEQTVATLVVDPGGQSVAFTCPAPRDAHEPGGAVAVYAGSLFPADKAAGVTCTVK